MFKQFFAVAIAITCSSVYAQEEYFTTQLETVCAKHSVVSNSLRERHGEKPTLGGMSEGKVLVIWANPSKHTATITVALDKDHTCAIAVIQNYTFFDVK